jgi:prolipoprotein diacylglyceryltransferase
VYLDTILNMSAPEQARRGGTLAARAGLIALMLVGSLALWLGDPVLWLWITARLQSTQASMGPYALMLLGITLTAVAIGKGLSRLNRLYAEVTGTAPTVRIIVPWRRSMRDARHGGSSDDDARVPVGLLEVVMVVAVLIALIALALWFLVVHPAPPLPGGPGGAKR